MVPVTLQSPFGGQRNLHNEARSAEYDGMDVMGWDGMGRNIKSVLQFSLYFVGI